MADPGFEHVLHQDISDGEDHDSDAMEDGEGNGLLALQDRDDAPDSEDGIPDIIANAALRRGDITEEQYRTAAAGLPPNLPFLLNQVGGPHLHGMLFTAVSCRSSKYPDFSILGYCLITLYTAAVSFEDTCYVSYATLLQKPCAFVKDLSW